MQQLQIDFSVPILHKSLGEKCRRVLDLLHERRALGVTFNDFPTGFRLGARIFDLRQDGFDIVTEQVHADECTYARYILRGGGMKGYINEANGHFSSGNGWAVSPQNNGGRRT